MIRQLMAATSGLAILAFMSACDSTESATPPPFTPSTAPSSTTTPSDGSAEAASAAAAAYKKYRQAIDAMTSSGGVDVKGIPLVTTGVELQASQIQAETYRGRKIHTVGSTDVIWVRTTATTPSAAGAITAAAVEACYDTTSLIAVDATGKNLRPPGTPTRWLDRRSLLLIDGSWRVSNGRNEAAKC